MFATLTITILLLCLTLSLVESINVLILGDSLDRCSVEDWCKNFLGSDPTPWVGDNLKYFTSPGGLTCHDGKGSRLTSLMIFGSNKTGPYISDQRLRECHCIIDTPNRIKVSLEVYFNIFKTKPDLIMLHTSEWDVHHWVIDDQSVFINPHAEFYRATNKTLQFFKQAVNNRLDDIQKSINAIRNSTSINLALRTDVYWPLHNPYYFPYSLKKDSMDSVFNNFKSNSLHTGAAQSSTMNRLKFILQENNQIQRQIAEQRQMSFFDYNYDVWSVYDFDYTKANFAFRDNLHPNWRYASAYALKLLGLRYTCNLNASQTLQKALPPLLVDRDPLQHYAYTLGEPIRRILVVEAPVGFKQHGSEGLYFVSYNLINVTIVVDDSTLVFNKNNTISQLQLHLYRHLLPDTALLRRFSLGPGDIFTPSSISEWHHFKPGDPLPVWMSIENLQNNSYLVHCVDTIFQSHHNVEWWLLENMERRPLPYLVADGNKTAHYLGAILLEDSEVRWDFLEIFGLAIPMPNIYQEYSLFRMENEKIVYVNINGTKHQIVNSKPEELFLKYGWKMVDKEQVLDMVRIWDTKKIQEGEPLLGE